MAYVTKSLSFAVTASTTYENPYATARRFSTLDHLTKGRVGWNIVTSYLESAAKAFGLDEQIPHDQRYERAEEYLEVVYKLLEGSWKEDSRIKDAASGRYSASERVRAIEHNGWVAEDFRSTYVSWKANSLSESISESRLLTSFTLQFSARHSFSKQVPLAQAKTSHQSIQKQCSCLDWSHTRFGRR